MLPVVKTILYDTVLPIACTIYSLRTPHDKKLRFRSPAWSDISGAQHFLISSFRIHYAIKS